MNFPSINIQGNIVSGEILDKLSTEDIKHQSALDFGFAKNTKIRDEIGLAWSSARGFWQGFKMRKERIGENDSGTTETRNFWMLPFMSTLGYELDKSSAEIIDGKSYAISHRSSNLAGYPVHIMGIHDSLDKRRDTGGPRLSPHALLQEYLNKTDNYLYAIVTNGKHLRLLRDATRLVRLTYLEFDLEKMMEEELFADFAILYRILHVSRMPNEKAEGESSIIEFYHQESLASGTRIREKLSAAVESSIKRLGNGFLKHPENQEIRALVQSEQLSGKELYLYLLRLIYRFLFLLVTEDRGLVYAQDRDEKLQKLRKIYYDFYSMDRLRNLALRRIFVESEKHDLWENIKVTFQLFESGKHGQKLGIQPLGSGIFHSSALGILSRLKIKNEDLLYVIHRLCFFQDEQRKQLVKVNFGDLDVEEFGSVYQGLLEFDPVFTEVETSPNFGFIQGTERSSSGSHYTPEELVRPLIQHSLEYIIQDCLEKPEERLKLTVPNAPKPVLQQRALLAIKVCDISCGSGHILLSAARRIGTELAKVRTGEDQPTPTAMRQAVRDVIRECIYGVDKNPLAVELCKVALWLEAHSPGEPLNFLDHKIKCGDAIVGLAHKEEIERGIAEEAFKALPGDDKAIATSLRNRNKAELKQKEQLTMDYSEDVNASVAKAIEQFNLFKNLPERTPEEIEAKQKQYQALNKGTNYARLKSLADMQVAQFFIPKTAGNKGYICTDATYRKYLREKTIPSGMPPAKSEALAQEKGFFHYFLEFPEVFAASKNSVGTEGSQGGFDCILGNPPFLGGGKISSNFGSYYYQFIKNHYQPIGGQCDFVAYFVRNAFKIINKSGFVGLITTNTISQGDTREGSLDQIIRAGGEINFAINSKVWPGIAAVFVSLFCLNKGSINKVFLGEKQVSFIDSFLTNNKIVAMPQKLNQNKGNGFLGSGPVGDGFLRDATEANLLIKKDLKNSEVLKPYLTGDDLNKSFRNEASRYAIYFFDWELEKTKKYPDCFSIVESVVKPERAKNNDKRRREIWWQFSRPTVELYKEIRRKQNKQVFVQARVSKTHGIARVDSNQIFSDALVVFNYSSDDVFSILQSCFHEEWSWKYSFTMKGDRRYTPSDCFETFPFPKEIDKPLTQKLILIGSLCDEFRSKIMFNLKIGLTKLSNLVHLEFLSSVDIEVKSKQERLLCVEGFQNIVRLRKLYKDMNEVVLEAYGWTDIPLRHDFYEVDYLPENDRVRYTIHPEARKEILKRLLELNHQYFEDEAMQGLHKEQDVNAFYEQKGQPVPEEVSNWFKKGKGKDNGASPKPPQKKKTEILPDLFSATTPLFSQGSNQKIALGSKVTVRSDDAKERKYILQPAGENGSFSADGFKVILADSALAQAMMDKMEGASFEFGGLRHRILKVD